MGDRQMKSLLSMAACTAIQYDSELRQYYKKKREEGKLKMIALNNVRNKLLSRVFAVVKRGTPYVELQKFAAWKFSRKSLDLTLEYGYRQLTE